MFADKIKLQSAKRINFRSSGAFWFILLVVWKSDALQNFKWRGAIAQSQDLCCSLELAEMGVYWETWEKKGVYSRCLRFWSNFWALLAPVREYSQGRNETRKSSLRTIINLGCFSSGLVVVEQLSWVWEELHGLVLSGLWWGCDVIWLMDSCLWTARKPVAKLFEESASYLCICCTGAVPKLRLCSLSPTEDFLSCSLSKDAYELEMLTLFRELELLWRVLLWFPRFFGLYLSLLALFTPKCSRSWFVWRWWLLLPVALSCSVCIKDGNFWNVLVLMLLRTSQKIFVYI